MSKIVLSCGHEVDDMDHGYTIFTKTTDREGNKAVAYQTVCGPCEDRYRQQGEILDSEEAERLYALRHEDGDLLAEKCYDNIEGLKQRFQIED